MSLQTYTLDQFVNAFINTVQAYAPQLTDSEVGSILRALAEATAGNSLSIQNQIVTVSNLTRLASCEGPDVDSYINDYGMSRNGAQFALGQVTLTRSLTTSQLNIPIANNSAIISTGIGGQQYALIADDNQQYYDPIAGQYYFPPGVNTITVTVIALVAGSAGNALPGTVTTIVAGLGGVTSVTNLARMAKGADPETDPQVKARFVLYLASLATANKAAIQSAILSTQAGVTFQLLERLYIDGTTFPSGFTAVVDDGTGTGNPVFIQSVYSNIDSVRGCGIEFEVHPPTNVTINISCHIVPQTGQPTALVQNNLRLALAQAIVAFGTGNTATYATLANLIEKFNQVYSASNILVNGGTTDIAISSTQLAVPGTVTFT